MTHIDGIPTNTPAVQSADSEMDPVNASVTSVRSTDTGAPVETEVEAFWDEIHSTGGAPVSLANLLNNDQVGDPDNAFVFIPVPQTLENGTVRQTADGDYVFIPDEGAVGTDHFAYFIVDADGRTLDGGLVTIHVDNAISATTMPQNKENYTVYGSDGAGFDLALQPGADPVQELIGRATAAPQLKDGEGYSIENYQQTVRDLTVTDNGDGTSSVRFTLDYSAVVSLDGFGPVGIEDDSRDFEFTLVTHGESSVEAPLADGTAIELTPLLDTLAGQSTDTVILEIAGAEITAGTQSVTLDSGATVRLDAETGTLEYVPAVGQTTNDRFDVVLENGGYPRTRTIEILNVDLPVARRDSLVLFQPEDDAPGTFTFAGQVASTTGRFTEAELAKLDNVDWNEAFNTGIFSDPNGTNGDLDNLGLFHWLGGDTALTNKVLDTEFTVGDTTFTLRDHLYGEGPSAAPFSTPQEAGQFVRVGLDASRAATVTFNPLANDSADRPLTLTNATVIAPDTGLEVRIEDNQLVVTAPDGVSGDFTVEYTATDANGSTSTSYIDVTVNPFSQAEAIERGFAAERLTDIAGLDLTGLDVTRTADGDYMISVDGMDPFVVDGASFLFGPDFIEQMLIQFAIAGGAQALQQLHGEETHFDLSNPEEKQLYEMFVTVAAELGLTAGPYGDHFNGLLDTDRVFAEMAELLFGTDAGDAWIRDNIDDAIGALHMEGGFEALEGLDADELLDTLGEFLRADPPAPLLTADGEGLTTEQKDVVMSGYINQIGFLATYQGDAPDEEAINEGVEALVGYAADVYSPEAAAALRDDLLATDDTELDFSTLFNGLSEEEALEAILAGDYEAFGYTEDEFLTLLGNSLFELATAGLEIRNAATNPAQIAGLLGMIAQVVPANATQAELRAFVDDVVLNTTGRRRLGNGTTNIMDDFAQSLDSVGKRPQHAKFAKTGANFRSYNASLTGTRPIAGTLPGPDAGGFLMILVLGTAGLALNGGFTGTPAEKLTSAGWLTLLISGTATTIDNFIGPVGQAALKTGPLQSLLDDLSAIRPAPTGQPIGAVGISDDIAANLSDEALDDVGKVLKNPAAQRLGTVRGLLRAVGAVGLAGGTAFLGTSLAVQASQEDDPALKSVQAATSALWLGASAGATISGGVNIARSLGVSIGSTGSKIASIAGKTAGVLARATAFAYAITGAVQGVRAQQLVRETWDILLRHGGPDNEAGFFVKPEHHDLEPYGDAASGLWGALSSLFGFPPPTGFRPEYTAGTSNGIFGNQGGPSDIRLKTDIRKIGQVEHLGVQLYSWRYIDGDNARFVGVMAQELLENPRLNHAVFTFSEGPLTGHYGVNYDALGINFLSEAAYKAGADLLTERQKARVAA